MRKELTHYFISAIIITVLLLAYTLSSIFLLPDKGINISFVTQFWKLLLFILIGITLCFCGYLFFCKEQQLTYQKVFERLDFTDFAITLVPLTPIMQYILHNQDILNIHKSLVVFSFFALLGVVICVLIPLILSVLVKKQLLQIASTSFLYLIFSMASLSASNQWHQKGVLLTQTLALITAFIIMLAIAHIAKKSFSLVIIVFFAVNTISSIITTAPSKTATNEFSQELEKLPIYSEVVNKKPTKQNDIILLVYDGYASPKTLQNYGFNNDTHVNFLQKNGFHVYDEIYSTGPCTHSSMSGIFSVGIKPHPEYGNKMYEISRRHIVGGAVQSVLQQNGYKSLGIFQTDSFFRGTMLNEIKYDYYFPPLTEDESSLLIGSILEGEFRHEAGYDKINYETYLINKRQMLSQTQLSPFILYSHSNYPGHTQNSGKCRPNETSIHFEKVKTANQEMKQDIEKAIKNNRNAIVIVAGDHGPYLTKNCAALTRMGNSLDIKDVTRLDLQDRYGTFLAIRWPDPNYSKKHDIKILQDIFPAVFSYIFDDESLFDKTRAERNTQYSGFITKGVKISDGIIRGGKHNNAPLFSPENSEPKISRVLTNEN